MAVILLPNRKSRLEWALDNYHILGKPISFKEYPYLVDIYKDEHEYQVYMKSAQVGMSEFAVIESLYVADEMSGTILYLFPTTHHIGDFVQERVDKSIINSPYLHKKVFGDLSDNIRGRSKNVNKVGLKKIGKGFIYFRGTKSEMDVTSIAGDAILVDEFDRCNVKNIPLAEKRLNNSDLKWIRKFSTPIFPNGPIHELYELSDQRKRMVKCEHCNCWQELDWHRNFVKEYKGLEFENSGFLQYIPRDQNIDVNFAAKIASKEALNIIKSMSQDMMPVCQNCNKEFNRLNKATWEISFEGRSIHGWHISKLFSPRANIAFMYSKFIDSLSSLIEVEDFYRQELGMPYDAGGKGISKAMLSLKAKDYNVEEVLKKSYSYCTAGVDVGKVFHINISRIIDKIRIKVYKGIVKDEFDVIDLLKKYKVDLAVVDIEPEIRISRKIRDLLLGKVYLCKFGPINQKDFNLMDKDKEKEDKKFREWININHNTCHILTERTMSIDEATDSLLNFNPTCIYPKSYLQDEKWQDQMCALKRKIIISERDGEQTAVWKSTSPDHYRLADLYDFLASKVYLDLNKKLDLPTIIQNDKKNKYNEIFNKNQDIDRLIIGKLYKNKDNDIKIESDLINEIEITRYGDT